MTAAINFENPILIDLPLPIITPRLMIRPVMPGDGAARAQAVKETFDQLHKTMIWATKIPTIEECEQRAREMYAKFIRREDLEMSGFERSGNRLAIMTGLVRNDWHRREFEIGFWVPASMQGKGYATEATNALTRYAFEVLQARRVKITHSADNPRSKAIIEKLGFSHEGVLTNAHIVADGTMCDTHIYARTNTENLPDLSVRWGEEKL
ncbi:MAG: GNAT family N-acetyltransferase [Rhodospirillales bacterium]|nr:GNAT family N-acetyltransferase [Rhodospirillales bacterium]